MGTRSAISTENNRMTKRTVAGELAHFHVTPRSANAGSLDGRGGILGSVPSGVHVVHRSPTCVLALAEFVDVGISEHTAKVCDASPTAWVPLLLPQGETISHPVRIFSRAHLRAAGGVRW
jgi:hypothetical protein